METVGNVYVHLISFSWTFLLLFIFRIDLLCIASKVESKLLKHLLQDYDPLIRPVKNITDPLDLKIGLTLLQILDVNEKHQVITTNVWIRLFWKDVNLIWDPNDFENLTQIRIPPHLIWHPDVSLYNTAAGFTDIRSPNAIVLNDGDIIFVPPMVLKSTCKMDVTWFPFDEQICPLRMGSWTYSGDLLSLSVGNEIGDMGQYTDNGEWKVLAVLGKLEENHYECCPEPYHTIIYNLHIRRRSWYYFFSLIVPCALIGYLAILGFTLPPDSGEKLSLGVTVLFSLIVFLNQISESMPANSDAVPLLGVYFNCVMFMIASSVVSTIIVNLNQRVLVVKEMNGVNRKVFLCWLPRILRMKFNSLELEEEDPERSTHGVGVNAFENEGNSMGASMAQRTLLEDVVKKRINKEWSIVALVVDRLCLIISLLYVILAISFFLFTALIK